MTVKAGLGLQVKAKTVKAGLGFQVKVLTAFFLLLPLAATCTNGFWSAPKQRLIM